MENTQYRVIFNTKKLPKVARFHKNPIFNNAIPPFPLRLQKAFAISR